MTVHTLSKGGAPAGSPMGLRVLDDALMLPTAVLRASRIASNRAWMRQLLARTGIELCPHGKTTMAPALFDMQLADGAWGLTAATASHVRTYRAWGYRRILMANQLVGTANIAWVLEEQARDPAFTFYSLVDSVAGVDALAAASRERPESGGLAVLVELGGRGKRTGARSAADAVSLARHVASLAPAVRLVGIETFEGVYLDEAAGAVSVQALVRELVHAVRAIAEEQLFADGSILLSAGGSAYYDIVAAGLAAVTTDMPRVRPILRSGCYITHDTGIYSRLVEELATRSPDFIEAPSRLMPALEVWAHVQSLPEPGMAIVALGKRDIGFDTGMPTPVAWAEPGGPRSAVPHGYEVEVLWDQHCRVRVPANTPWRVGSLVGFGISHPCTTFDKWRVLHVVDDDDRVVDTIDTYF